MEDYYDRMVVAEIALSGRNPINEQAYALDDKTVIYGKNRALGLYDCLVPKVKSHSFRMNAYMESFNEKGILKEMQIEKLISLDIASDHGMEEFEEFE